MRRDPWPTQVPTSLLQSPAPKGPLQSYLHLPPSPPAWVWLSPGESEEQAGQVQGGRRQRRHRCGKEPQVGCRVHLLTSFLVESSCWALKSTFSVPPPLSLGTSLGDMLTHVVPAVRNRPAQTCRCPHRRGSTRPSAVALPCACPLTSLTSAQLSCERVTDNNSNTDGHSCRTPARSASSLPLVAAV